MTGIELLTATIGNRVATALGKQIVGEGPLANAAIDSLSDVVQGARLSFLQRRALERQLDQVAERVARQMLPFWEGEFGGSLPEDQRAGAITAASVTIGKGYTGPGLAAAADFDPQRLEALLRNRDPDAARRALLTDAGATLYDNVLAQSCVLLVELAAEDRAGEIAALAELLTRERAILEVVERLLERVPDPGSAGDPAALYRSLVVRHLDQLELFGLDVTAASRRFGLSVAYISLQAIREDDGDSEGDGGDPTARIEDLVADNQRLVVRGEAGSGKTTLLQWLAVQAVHRRHEAELECLNGTLPVFVRLRGYAEKPLPTIDGLTDSLSTPALADRLAGPWLSDLLDRGRALLLVDGVDEMPPDRRDEVRQWVSDIVLRFPNARIIVTTRPAAVEEDWLDEEHFAATELQPMDLAAIEACISHWHRAVGKSASENEADRLPELESELVAAIRRLPALRRLAETPLLCAMLCALNRDRDGALPPRRIEVYDIALDALLERRDRGRKLVLGPVELSKAQKLHLLRELAYWLQRNGRADFSRAEILERLGREAERLPERPEPEELLVLLHERTGLIREPVPDRFDFIHRTFQEYLAAGRAVEESDIGLLVNNAKDDRWREVIVLAAGLATPPRRDALLTALLDRGDADEEKHRLHLLAVACLQTAPTLDPSLQGRIADAVGALVPPRNLTEAAELAAAGDLAVGPLRSVKSFKAVEARAAVRTLGLIGTEEALQTLERFGADGRTTVVRELMRQWDRFDDVEYARRVLRTSPLFRGTLTVTASEDLRSLAHLEHLTHLTVRGEGRIDWQAIAAAPNVTDLHVLSDVDDLDFLETLPRLRALTAGYRSADAVQTPSAPNLRTLEIGSSEMSPAPDLRGLSGLEILALEGMVGDLTSVETLRELRELDVRRCHGTSFEWLAALPHLETLSIDSPQDEIMLPDVPADAALRLLNIESAAQRVHVGFGEHAPLRALRIARADHVRLAAWPAQLEIIDLAGVNLRDLSTSALPSGVKRLRLHDSVLDGTEQLREISALFQLTLQKVSGLRDLAGVNLEHLRSLVLLDVDDLVDLEWIRGAANLRTLAIQGTPTVRDYTALLDTPLLRVETAATVYSGLDLDTIQALGAEAAMPVPTHASWMQSGSPWPRYPGHPHRIWR